MTLRYKQRRAKLALTKGDNMSDFNTLSTPKLKEVAEAFGVEIGTRPKKVDIIEALIADGVTYRDYELFANAERVEPEDTDIFDVPSGPAEIVQTGKTVLVKMDRANPYFQVNGHTFTSANPFLALTEDEAQEIFDSEDGFRIATPAELKSFYS